MLLKEVQKLPSRQEEENKIMSQIHPPLKRSYVDNDFEINWASIKNKLEELENRTLGTKAELLQWLKDRSELEAVLSEDFAWRYIKMNIDTNDAEYAKAFQFYVQEINPKIAPYEDRLNKKLIGSEFASQLKGEDFAVMLRAIKTQIELFREKNIPLQTQLEEDAQKFGTIAAGLNIEYKSEEYTLQQASKFLKHTDRSVRKNVYHLIQDARNAVIEELNDLYNHLIQLRTQVAKNADFDNYRDYMFKAMGRFDYTVDDCYQIHNAVAKEVVPIMNQLSNYRKKQLGLTELKPWDTAVDIHNEAPLKPFETGEELLSKTIECFNRIDPFFGECLSHMKAKKHLDLESKKGKAPGGFNYPLYESGLPFIYMNAVGSFRDVTTMVHEGGHAIHSVLSHPLELVEFKSLTSEIAELASMGMELISMDHWDVFFDNEDDLKRAKRDQLLDVISTLPWVACIDKFQHWIYLNPDHSIEDRETYWLSLMDQFGSDVIDWKDELVSKRNLWQKQLHLFEVPFYYIEYGMAQLGAIALWKNYKENPKTTIEQYKKALSLGYTRTIGEVYATAGISFNFTETYIKELMNFVYAEIQKTLNS